MIHSTYNYLLIPVITLVMAQVVKVIVEALLHKKINLIRLLDGSGGMPSTHSSFAFSLLTSIGIGEGTHTTVFALAFVFACIIAYDAMGIRYEAGRQAKTINEIIDKLNWNAQFDELKERVGHKPIEVLCGIIFGTLMGFILMP